MITITKNALTKLVKISRSNNVNKILFYVKGGGCNGFSYNLKPINTNPNKLDEIINIYQGLDLVVDNNSIFHLIGTEIDWKNDIMGSRFDFNNPNADSKCGCGATFSLK
jgi:iron-sulfur cluster assembly accessory protein